MVRCWLLRKCLEKQTTIPPNTNIKSDWLTQKHHSMNSWLVSKWFLQQKYIHGLCSLFSGRTKTCSLRLSLSNLIPTYTPHCRNVASAAKVENCDWHQLLVRHPSPLERFQLHVEGGVPMTNHRTSWVAVVLGEELTSCQERSDGTTSG